MKTQKCIALFLAAVFLISATNGTWAKPKSAKIAKTGWPTAVMAAVSGQTNVRLTWNAAKNAKKYEVYRADSKNGKYTRIKTTSKRSFTDRKHPVGKIFYYKVRAYRTAGKKKVYGKFSAVRSVRMPMRPRVTPTPVPSSAVVPSPEPSTFPSTEPSLEPSPVPSLEPFPELSPMPSPEPTTESTPSAEPSPTSAPERDFQFNWKTGTIERYIGPGGDVVIPNSIDGVPVTTIGSYSYVPDPKHPWDVLTYGAFQDCTSLTGVIIPNSVITIDYSAFEGCKALSNVTIGNSVAMIRNFAFDGTALTSVIIPDSVTSLHSSFNNCSSLTSITVSENNPNYSSVDGVLFDKDMATLIRYPAGKVGAYTIPRNVTTIGVSAFRDCSSLTSIDIPNSVTKISDWAFQNCTLLENVILPNSVTFLGWYSFSGCTSLTSVIIPGSVTKIQGYAFRGCTSLKSVMVLDGVTLIDDWAFAGCTSLESAVIPDSVEFIRWSAFSYDDDYRAPWRPLPNLTIYCSEGSVAHTYAEIHSVPYSLDTPEAV